MQPSRQIALFNGNGTDKFLVGHTKEAIEKQVDCHQAVVTTFDQFAHLNGREISLLVIPGGDAMGLASALRGQNETVAKIVKEKNYLGICSGGIIGSKYFYFNDSNSDFFAYPLPSFELFKGKAVAPMQRIDPSPFSLFNAQVLQNQWKFKDGTTATVPLFHQLGPCFLDTDHDNVSVIAHYQNVELNYSEKGWPVTNPPSVIECKNGEATSILMGVHPELKANKDEITSDDKEELSHFEKAVDLLMEHQQEADRCFRDVLDRLGMPLTPGTKEGEQ